nr:MAG TPA: hypothetical protein [Bacteriophage sp.]
MYVFSSSCKTRSISFFRLSSIISSLSSFVPALCS